MRIRRYQKEDIAWLLKTDVGLYAADIGTGKSLVALKVFEARQAAGDVSKCLIVASPRILEHTWPVELKKWCPHLTYAVLHGGPRRCAAALEEDVDIYLTTYDTLKTIMGDLYDDINMIIFDESHKLKNNKTVRFKVAKKNIGSFPYRLMMTGSPMPNSLEDLWAQCRLLDGGASLGKFITHFRHHWFLPHPSGFGWLPRDGAEEEIFEELKRLMLRREATKEAGIPKVVVNDVFVTLPKSAQRIYLELEEEFVTLVKRKLVSVFNASAASMKLRQVCNGFVYGLDGKGRVAHKVHDQKLDALKELLENLQGKPLLVAYAFKQDVEMFKTEFGMPSFTGLSLTKAHKLKATWDSGRLPALAIHPASAGEGLNFQNGGHHLCFFGLQWNPALYWQTIGRLARSGQKHPVFVHRILIKGSIEERMAYALIVKNSNQQRLFDAVKKEL